MSLKLVPARLLCVILIATSLVQHEVAFAAVSVRTATTAVQALVVPEDMGTALNAINESKRREVDSYFANGTTQAELNRFHADVDTLIKANAIIRFVAEPNDFKKWFHENEAAILANRKKMNSGDLQEMIVETYIAFRAQKAQDISDLPGFVQELKALIDSPATMLAGGLAAAYGTYAFTRDIVKGAMIAGPAAGSVSAYLEPIVRPIREYLSVIGNRHWGKKGMWLTQKLNSEKAGLIESREKIEAREAARAKTVALMARIGHSMTADQATNNMELFKENWNEAKQTWESTNPAFYRDGRANVTDMLVLRPVAVGNGVLGSVSGAENFRAGIIYATDRIKDKSGKPELVDSLTNELQKTVKEQMMWEKTDQKKRTAAATKMKTISNELVSLGAEPAQVKRIIENHQKELVFFRHTATSLAGSAMIELMYEEFNRELPEKMATAYEQFRSNYCFEFFHKEFHSEVDRILNEFGLELSNSKKAINTDIAAIDEKIAEIEKGGKPKRANAANERDASTRVEIRTHRPVIVPNRKLVVVPATKPTAKPVEKAAAKPVEKSAAKPVEKPATKAVEALKGFVGAASNRAAAAGSEDLKPGKKKTMADRAREAAARAAKK